MKLRYCHETVHKETLEFMIYVSIFMLVGQSVKQFAASEVNFKSQLNSLEFENC